MQERSGLVTMKKNPLTLLGGELTPGDDAPNFTATDPDLNEVNFKEKDPNTYIIISVPSLDTPVCNKEAKRFNEEASDLPNTKIITISMDLPFAQARWASENDIKKIELYSDFNNASFGKNYGVLIKEQRLLARAVFIVDTDWKIKYTQLVNEVTDEPDYEEVLKAAKELAKD